MENDLQQPQNPQLSGHWHPNPMQKAILVFGVIITVILLGFYAYATYLAKVAYDKVAEEARKAESLERTTEQPDTSTWLTYRDDQFGFEFKYPGDWTLSKKNNQVNPLDTRLVNLESKNYGNLAVYTQGYLEIAELYRAKYTFGYSSSTLNGKNVPWAAGYTANDYDRRADMEIYEIKLGTTIASIAVFVSENPSITHQEKWNRLNQILSTFQFIDTTDTSTWKTYRNEEYGFEFKYPGDWIFLIRDDGQVLFQSPETVKSTEDNYKNCDSDINNDVGSGGCIPEWINFNFYLRPSINNSIWSNISDENRESYKPEEKNINNLVWTKYHDLGLFDLAGYIIKNNSNTVALYIVADTESEKLLNQILSTFRFTK